MSPNISLTASKKLLLNFLDVDVKIGIGYQEHSPDWRRPEGYISAGYFKTNLCWWIFRNGNMRC